MQSTLEVLIIKENYLDFENLLFFEVYYSELISLGLLDEENYTFPGISENSDTLYSFYQNGIRTDLWVLFQATEKKYQDSSYSKLLQSLAPMYIKNDETLYTVDRSKRIVMFRMWVDNSAESLYKYIGGNTFKNILKNYVVIKNVTNTSFEYEVGTGYNSSYNLSSAYFTNSTNDNQSKPSGTAGNYYIGLTCWTTVNVTESNQTNLTWNVGVGNVASYSYTLIKESSYTDILCFNS